MQNNINEAYTLHGMEKVSLEHLLKGWELIQIANPDSDASKLYIYTGMLMGHCILVDIDTINKFGVLPQNIPLHRKVGRAEPFSREAAWDYVQKSAPYAHEAVELVGLKLGYDCHGTLSVFETPEACKYFGIVVYLPHEGEVSVTFTDIRLGAFDHMRVSQGLSPRNKMENKEQAFKGCGVTVPLRDYQYAWQPQAPYMAWLNDRPRFNTIGVAQQRVHEVLQNVSML